MIIIDLDETYTNSFRTMFGKQFKIEANMKITGNVFADVHSIESLIEGKTSIWVNDIPYSVSYTQKYDWLDLQ